MLSDVHCIKEQNKGQTKKPFHTKIGA